MDRRADGYPCKRTRLRQHRAYRLRELSRFDEQARIGAVEQYGGYAADKPVWQLSETGTVIDERDRLRADKTKGSALHRRRRALHDCAGRQPDGNDAAFLRRRFPGPSVGL